KRTAEQINQLQETSALVAVSEKEILDSLSAEDKARHKSALEALGKFPKPTPLPMSLALQNSRTNLPRAHVLVRGDYNRPREEVWAALPKVLASVPLASFARSTAESTGQKRTPRAELAEWMVSPKNPLTARVIVNRLWQHHFGRGLVASPGDFGTQGRAPTHPEMLDWLASELVAQHWSLKQMHRLLMQSSVYQQSGRASETALRRDPENRLFSRRERVRLEGEVIWDSLLAISGRLNRTMHGPGVFPPIPEELFQGARGWTASTRPADHHRRSIYIFARRNLRFPFLEVFDAPDSNLSCPERLRSTSAPQALTLLNAEEVMSASRSTADRLLGQSPPEQVILAYRLILGRPPTETEERRARAFLKSAPLSELCRALFNLNAFSYVE
ncbi:MAG: DUF1553 domain-containing protein, partial [Verrucomicrobiota bacterium]